ncbi:uncharacterized protein LOC128882890 [Hylaeus volcanicus]|uniref:uncharacterized protein LOC128882890 n=1 Tax=Hylaeus volcanicus TaxID=313075 RepID=UPI0023B7D53D|nr:uncharacterized protein LOC128882890 [Hylaeus volcanicus]
MVPQTFYYTTVLLFTYSVFFEIGSEICRIRQQPIQGLKYLPTFFFSYIEQQALREVPMSIVRKNLSGEEHLYILLRATQSIATRKVALDFIIQSHRKRYKSDEKDCVSQLFYRNAVLWYHLDSYTGNNLPNFIQSLSPSFKLLPQQRKLTSYFNSVSHTYTISQQSDLQINKEKYSPMSTTQQRDIITEAGSHWNSPRIMKTAAENISARIRSQVNRVYFQKDSNSILKEECQMISTGKRYFCTPKLNTANPCAYSECLTPCLTDSSFSDNEINDNNLSIATQQLKSYEPLDPLYLSETVQTLGEELDLSNSFQSSLWNDSNISVSEKQQSETLFLDGISDFGKTKHRDRIQPEYTLPHIGVDSSSMQSALSERYSFIKPKKTYVNSTKIHEQMRHQANLYDQMLKKTIKHHSIPITANKYFFRPNYTRFKLTKLFNKFLGRASFRLRGIDSIMCNAQWRHTIAIPKCYIFGDFVDRKIERWFLSWLSFLQAQQQTKRRSTTSILLFSNFFVGLLRFYTLLSKNSNGKNVLSNASNRNYLFYFISKFFFQIFLTSILLYFQDPKYLKASFNAHAFKRYSLFMGIINSGFPLLDAYVEQVLFPEYPVTFSQILYSSITFPTLSQTSVTTNVVFCAVLLVCLYYGFCSHNATMSTHLSYNISVIYIGFLMSVFVLYISRCIMTNYRFLFCHYVLPYLLYIDALQPIGEPCTNDEIMQVVSCDY